MDNNYLHNNLGLSTNPFSKRSSEQELEFINEIFYEPNYYNTLISDLVSGDSRFIIGQRGHGKTSIINKLYEDLENREDVFIVKIERYDSIPLKENERSFLLLIIETLIKKQAIYLLKNKHIVSKLNNHEKEALGFFIQIFFRPITKVEFEDTYNKIKNIRRKNLIIWLLNKFGIDFANNIASSVVNITSDFIRQSIGLDRLATTDFYKEYFSKITEVKIEKKELTVEDFTKDRLKDILYKICEIYSKIGFSRIIVLFDKIDECQMLSQDVVKISNFTGEILSDTELLLNENISIGFSLWSELKSELSGIVRFDKFGVIDVRWRDVNMIPLINKRLKYYSIDKANSIGFNSLISNEIDRNDIVRLCNKSPRDLIVLLSEIYQEQSNRKPMVTTFDNDSIRRGMINFCRTYDYDSMIPSKTGKNKEVKSMINKLLRLRITRFTYKDLTLALNQNDNQSQGQIKIMIGYRLIKEEEFSDVNGMKIYEIIEPKVEFMIKHLIENIES